MNDKVRYIVAYNLGGLGNRLKCLVSSMRHAEETSKDFRLCWPVTSSCRCAFNNLFDNNFQLIEKDEVEKVIISKNSDYKIISTWALDVFPNDPIKKGFTKARSSTDGRTIDFEYGRIPVSIRDIYLKYWTQLKPSSAINNEVEKFSKQFTPETISVHIRSWHNEKGDEFGERQARHFDIKKVYSLLDKHKGKTFFVASDSELVLSELIKRYGNAVKYYQKNNTSRNKEDGIKDALIEMYLLSKNPHLIATTRSTFSEVAWWLGGAKATVEVIPLKYPLKNKDFVEAILSQVKISFSIYLPNLYSFAKRFTHLTKRI